MANAASEIIWLQALLKEMKVENQKVAALYCDNQAAMHITANFVFQERTKHIEIDCQFVREKIGKGTLKTLYVATQHQLADYLTKPLYPTHLKELLLKMGINNIHAPS